MDPRYITTARAYLDEFKKIMVTYKDSAIHPVALFIMPNLAEVMMVMEWRSPEEKDVVLDKMVVAARAAGAAAVVVFGTANALMPQLGDVPALFLFADIHVPNEKTYSLGQIYALVDGNIVFLDEMNSSTHNILFFQIPSIWGEQL